MKQKEIDEFFEKHEKEIYRNLKFVYLKVFKNTIDIITPEDLFEEFYLFCTLQRFKIKQLSLNTLFCKQFARYIRFKYAIDIATYRKIKRLLDKANETIM